MFPYQFYITYSHANKNRSVDAKNVMCKKMYNKNENLDDVVNNMNKNIFAFCNIFNF